MSNTRYNVDEKNIYNIDFELLYISKSKYENDWHSTSHFHPFTEIFFIIHGNGLMEIDDTTISIKEGDLVIINPNCTHTEKSSVNINERLEYIVFGINNLALFNKKDSKVDISSCSSNLYKIMNFTHNKNIILYSGQKGKRIANI